MASLTSSRRLADELLSGDKARVLLVNKDPQDLFHYRAILQELGCKVRASSSFAEGVQCIGDEPFDLIILDQGSGMFEGQEVLAQAMEVDVELRVLVLARSYDRGCYLQAMQSGALDYLEGPLGAAEIIALLETFVPRRGGMHDTSVNRVKGGIPSKKASAI
jgi:DNA-binding NtrC family response regulator